MPVTHPPNEAPPPKYYAPPPPNEGNDDDLEGGIAIGPNGVVVTGAIDFSGSTPTGLPPATLPNPALVNVVRAHTTAVLDLAASSSADDVTFTNDGAGALTIAVPDNMTINVAAGTLEVIAPGGGVEFQNQCVFDALVQFDNTTNLNGHTVLEPGKDFDVQGVIRIGGAPFNGGSINGLALENITPFTVSGTIAITDDIIDASTTGADTVLTLPAASAANGAHQFLLIRRTDDAYFNVIIQAAGADVIGPGTGTSWYLGGIGDFVVLAVSGANAWAVLGQSGKRSFSFGPLTAIANNPAVTAVSRLGFTGSRQLRRLLLDTNGTGAAPSDVVVHIGGQSFTLASGAAESYQQFNPGTTPVAGSSGLPGAPLITIAPAGTAPSNFCVTMEFD
ncbi:MAG TPA: hypothetical protein VK807_23365 [Gemmatimonadaceae bacterium]|jgi:hypothetical protein|nr:hypothetical protein [Gemmatimonadaceae bacterium]